MHLYFRSGGTVAEVVAQGLRDTIGNFGSVSAAAREEAMRWLRLFHLEGVADMPYRNLSAGIQRLVLIARTFIKHPDLLIFDEPLHGLDAARKRAVRAVVNEIARRDSPTLVYVTHYLPEVPGVGYTPLYSPGSLNEGRRKNSPAPFCFFLLRV